MTDIPRTVQWPTLPRLNASGQPMTPGEQALEDLKELEKLTGRMFPASNQPADQHAAGEDLLPGPVPIDVAAENSAYADLMKFFRDNPEEDTKDFEALSEDDFAKGLVTSIPDLT